MNAMTTPASIHERLRSPDAGVRRIAVIDLPYTDEEDDVAPLLTAALADTDAQVRLEAAKALEGFEETEVLAQLVPLLKDCSAEVRDAVAYTLAELKQPASAAPLLPYLVDSNCTLGGPNPVSAVVTSGATTNVSFAVTCLANPILRTTLVTTGPNAPTNYLVGVDSDYYYGGFGYSAPIRSMKP